MPTKIYLLIVDSGYDGSSVDSVFESLEAARAYAAAKPRDERYNEWRVEECVLSSGTRWINLGGVDL